MRQARPRARYFGVASPEYAALNPTLFSVQTGSAEARSAAPALREPWDRAAFLRAAVEDGLDRLVRVVRLPVALEPELAASAIAEMGRLREQGDLTVLRGGRPTDLPRPLPAALRAKVRAGCRGLQELLRRVESALAGSSLFVRAIKIDEARASTTQPDADRAAGHLHFDAERSGLADYSEPVFQYYANAARLPRLFRVVPVPLPEMIAGLTRRGALASGEAETLPLSEILRRFRAAADVSPESIPVPSGCLALFNGRIFAHDAGKPDLGALVSGRFEPAVEQDLVLALDNALTGHHRGYYNPEMPFLDDPGVE